MDYRESLPENCPPETAGMIDAERVVYRLVAANPPSNNDFRSQRDLRPIANFKVTECQARGLSVHTVCKDSEEARKLPYLRGKLVCQVALTAGAGAIMQTGKPSHHTWWPLAGFDIISRCTVENV